MSDRPSKALSTMLAGGAALLPIYPKTFEDVVRLARMAIISGMVKPQQIGWGDAKETERPEATEARATKPIKVRELVSLGTLTRMVKTAEKAAS